LTQGFSVFSLIDIPATHDERLAAALQDAIDSKTKPPGSLGVLEALALRMGLIQRTLRPSVRAPRILVFAADHGVAQEGVSAYPQSVTWQMVENVLAGGGAVNVFARCNQVALDIVDAGVNHDFGRRTGLLDRKQGYGTRNFAREAAMTRQECLCALQAGAALVADMARSGPHECADAVEARALAGGRAPAGSVSPALGSQQDAPNVLGFGEMGIGNTTSAAAIMHRLADVPLAECVGAGTGLSPQGVRHKQAVIERAMALHGDAREPLDVLAAFGGFEIAMMTGAMLQAAAMRMTLLIDGFIVTSALLVAARLQPFMLDYCVFCHSSNERGHARMLRSLDARPLLDLGLRLGEGTGCALAVPLLRCATGFLDEMATFDSAGVSGQAG
jgi:nicotinate-nucleotide--dimethylbenzimidazole phosphoribosyltransferase